MVTGLDMYDDVYKNASYQCHNVRMDSENSSSTLKVEVKLK